MLTIEYDGSRQQYRFSTGAPLNDGQWHNIVMTRRQRIVRHTRGRRCCGLAQVEVLGAFGSVLSILELIKPVVFVAAVTQDR